MNTRLLFLFALFFGFSACASETPEPEAAETPEVTEMAEAPSGPPFLALHLYNPASDEAHQRFLGFLSELNEAVASTGQSNTQYRVWKVTGEPTGDYTYLFGSIWADRATYDAVHDHDAYKAVMARIENSGLKPFQAEVYNRYSLLNPASGETPPMPGDGATYLSMHLLNRNVP